MAKLNVVTAAKDYPNEGIKKGDTYYWWQFRFGGKKISKTKPKRSQLTQSSFYGAIYDLEDDVIAAADADENLGGVRDDIISTLEDLKQECEDSLENIPDSLKEAPTGSLLQERIDALDSAISEFENLELDEPDDSELELDEVERSADESDADYEARMEEARDVALQAYWEGKLEELQGISIDAP